MKEILDFNNLEKYFDDSSRSLVDETFNIGKEQVAQKAVLADGTIDLTLILESAQTFIDNGDLRVARRILSKVLSKFSKSAQVFDLLAQCYLLESNYDFAIECLNEALKLEPKTERYKKMASIFINKSEDGKAVWLLKDCLKKITHDKEESHEITRLIASSLYRMQDYEEANKTISAILMGTTTAADWTLRGQISLELKDFKISHESFLKALSLDFENTGALFGMAKLSKMNNELEGATGFLETLLKVRPDDIAALTLLVETLLVLKKYDLASDHLNRYLQTIDRHPKIIYCLSLIYYRMGRDKECLELLGEIELNTDIGSSVRELSEKILRKRNCVSNIKRESIIT